MKIIQKKFSESLGWEHIRSDDFDPARCNLLLVFGSRQILAKYFSYAALREEYPLAHIVSASTAGEITDTQVTEHTISLTAIWFENTEIKVGSVTVDGLADSLSAGKELAQLLDHAHLKHVMVISDGHHVNGSDMVTGLQDALPQNVIITGGLAGDGSGFKKTIVGLNEMPAEGKIVAIGFYGDFISTSYGSVGGWGSFGNERLITRSKGNVLYELDGKPALDIYKLYLGDYAGELPASALLFPLSIRGKELQHSLVRTILGVDEGEKSLTFAGNMPEGNYARLMKANFDKLIGGASDAAQNSLFDKRHMPDLAILISCVGRKLVLNQRVEEEIEVIRTIYGEKTCLSGFYSYGEISPSFKYPACELHNQTMTITTFTETTP